MHVHRQAVIVNWCELEKVAVYVGFRAQKVRRQSMDRDRLSEQFHIQILGGLYSEQVQFYFLLPIVSSAGTSARPLYCSPLVLFPSVTVMTCARAYITHNYNQIHIHSSPPHKHTEGVVKVVVVM